MNNLIIQFATCGDGAHSNSEGSGTCSWHGGVDSWDGAGGVSSSDIWFILIGIIVFLIAVCWISILLYKSRKEEENKKTKPRICQKANCKKKYNSKKKNRKYCKTHLTKR